MTPPIDRITAADTKHTSKMFANTSTKIQPKHTADKPNYFEETHRTNCPKAWGDKEAAVVILLKRREQKEIEAEESQWQTADTKENKTTEKSLSKEV